MRISPTLLGLSLFALLAATPPVGAAPSGVVAYAPNQSRVHLSWKDLDNNETAYWVDRWVPDPVDPENPEAPETGIWDGVGTLPPNTEVFRALAPSTEGSPPTDEKTVKYRVAAIIPGQQVPDWVEVEVDKPSGDLDLYSELIQIEDEFLPREIPEGSEARVGTNFDYTIEFRGGTPESFFAEELPQGATFDTTTGIVTWPNPTVGVHRFFVGVEFEGNKRFKQVRYVRVLPPPSSPIVFFPSFNVPPQAIGVKGFVNIEDIFRDPARPKGAWFDTSYGSFVVALHDQATPKTVNNFLAYVAAGDYDGSIVHRAARTDPPASGRFIIQGGGAKPTTVSNIWSRIPSRGNIPNEAGFTNRRGTIAMAKSGSTDSATSEWFVSTGTGNPGILDRQSGGFTVFGEVIGSSGMSVADTINDRPTSNFTSAVTVSGTHRSEVPSIANIAPSTPNNNNLVRVFSVTQSPAVAISLVSNSNPSVLSAGVAGMLLYVESRGIPGSTNLLLRATNLDGNTVDFNLPITIRDVVRPVLRLTSIRASRPFGTLLVKGRARDDVALGKLRYKVNGQRWKNAGRLNGKNAAFSRKMKGFKRGRNVLRIEVYDQSGNSSGVLTQRFTLG